MSILDFFKPRRTKEIKLSEAFIIETTERVYLKRLAMDICINYLARTIANSEFRVMDNKQVQKDVLYWKLNVRPNTDSSASDFWHKLVYKLISDNEVLAIQTDSNDLVIADDFNRNKFALYPDIFTDVRIGDYTFERSFNMDEVLYLEYNNQQLAGYIDSLYSDYGKLFGQMMDHNMRHNQFRGFIQFGDGGDLSDEMYESQKAVIQRLTETFEQNSVAIAPMTDGVEFTDLSNTGASRDESVSNLVKLKRDLTDDVAKMLGIPTNLIHGDVADMENTMEAYISFCVKPLLKKISDEINAKFITQEEWLSGKRIKIFGINQLDPVKNASAVDKLISSGGYSRNEVREKFGDERVDDPELDRYIMTKNYAYTDETETEEGGEKE